MEGDRNADVVLRHRVAPVVQMQQDMKWYARMQFENV